MKTLLASRSEEVCDSALAIVLEGVSEEWQMNVLPIRGSPTQIDVTLDGFGTINVPAISLTPGQARRLAAQIIETLGPEA